MEIAFFVWTRARFENFCFSACRKTKQNLQSKNSWIHLSEWCFVYYNRKSALDNFSRLQKVNAKRNESRNLLHTGLYIIKSQILVLLNVIQGNKCFDYELRSINSSSVLNRLYNVRDAITLSTGLFFNQCA